MRFLLVLVLIALGIAGLILPLLPGVPFFIVALYLLGFVSRKRLLKLFRNFKGKKGSLQRKVVGWIIISFVRGKRLR